MEHESVLEKIERVSKLIRGTDYSPQVCKENSETLKKYIAMPAAKRAEYLEHMADKLVELRKGIVSVYNKYPVYFYHMHYTLDNLDQAVLEYQRIADNIRNHGNDTAITAAVALFR